MLDRTSYANGNVCVAFRDADILSIGRPETIDPMPSEGLLKRGIYKVGSDISLQVFKELISREYDSDSYLTSALYYQTVGHRGLWIYKEGLSFLPFCADPTVPDRFILFPARGKANIHLLRNLLARLPPAKFGYSLVRVRNSLNLGQTLKQARIPLKSVQHNMHQNIDTVFKLFSVDKLKRSLMHKVEALYTFTYIEPKHKAGLSLWLNRSENDICLLPYFNAAIIEGLVARRTGIACYKNAKLFGFAVWDYSNSIEPTANVWLGCADIDQSQTVFMLRNIANIASAQGVRFLALDERSYSSLGTIGIEPEISYGLKSMEIIIRDKIRDVMPERPLAAPPKVSTPGDISP